MHSQRTEDDSLGAFENLLARRCLFQCRKEDRRARYLVDAPPYGFRLARSAAVTAVKDGGDRISERRGDHAALDARDGGCMEASTFSRA